MMRGVEDPNNTKSAEDLVFGYECSGIVQEVGKSVKNFKFWQSILELKRL